MCVICLILLTGCGSGPDTNNPTAAMPDDIKPFYNQFFQIIGRKYESGGQIQLVQLNKNSELGRCIYTKPWVIEIDQNSWTNGFLTEDGKRAIVFHELTHCIFNSSAHSSDILSYMNKDANLNLDSTAISQQVLDYTAKL